MCVDWQTISKQLHDQEGMQSPFRVSQECPLRLDELPRVNE